MEYAVESLEKEPMTINGREVRAEAAKQRPRPGVEGWRKEGKAVPEDPNNRRHNSHRRRSRSRSRSRDRNVRRRHRSRSRSRDKKAQGEVIEVERHQDEDAAAEV